MAKAKTSKAVSTADRPEHNIKDKRGRGKPYDPQKLQFYDKIELDALIDQKSIAYHLWMERGDVSKARACVTYMIRAHHAKRKLGCDVRKPIAACKALLAPIRIAADGQYLATKPR